MENNTKKIIMWLLAVCMIFAMVGSIPDSCYGAETKASVNQKIKKLEKEVRSLQKKKGSKKTIQTKKKKISTYKKALTDDVVLDQASVAIGYGKTCRINATMKNKTSSINKIKWTTGDKKIATVTSKGLIKGVGIGSCTITAQASVSGKKATVQVTVGEKGCLSTVSFKRGSERIDIEQGTVTIDFTYNADYNGKFADLEERYYYYEQNYAGYYKSMDEYYADWYDEAFHGKTPEIVKARLLSMNGGTGSARYYLSKEVLRNYSLQKNVVVPLWIGEEQYQVQDQYELNLSNTSGEMELDEFYHRLRKNYETLETVCAARKNVYTEGYSWSKDDDEIEEHTYTVYNDTDYYITNETVDGDEVVAVLFSDDALGLDRISPNFLREGRGEEMQQLLDVAFHIGSKADMILVTCANRLGLINNIQYDALKEAKVRAVSTGYTYYEKSRIPDGTMEISLDLDKDVYVTHMTFRAYSLNGSLVYEGKYDYKYNVDPPKAVLQEVNELMQKHPRIGFTITMPGREESGDYYVYEGLQGFPFFNGYPIPLFRDKELKDMIFLEELKDGMEVYIEEYPSWFGL